MRLHRYNLGIGASLAPTVLLGHSLPLSNLLIAQQGAESPVRRALAAHRMPNWIGRRGRNSHGFFCVPRWDASSVGTSRAAAVD